MELRTIKRIIDAYGLAAAELRPPQKGYRNRSYPVKLANGRWVNLLVYKREPGITAKITNANRVADFLAQKGLPARQTADRRIICLQGAGQQRYGSLYSYLPGKTIPWEAYTKEHIKQLGGAMGRMHAVLKGLGRHKLPLVTDEYLAVCERMQGYFAEPGVRRALKRKLGLDPPRRLAIYPKLLAALSKTEGQQPLHMDFVRGNILFDKAAQITGILDFEKTAWGHPAFDLARTLAFLLVDCKYKDETKIRKYFLLSGYNKRGHSSFTGWKILEPLLDLFLIHDFYKFLRHNPYESLDQNEHYLRTRDLLAKRKLLSRSH